MNHWSQCFCCPQVFHYICEKNKYTSILYPIVETEIFIVLEFVFVSHIEL